jgi:CDP-glucose 4,6-dehydratase
VEGLVSAGWECRAPVLVTGGSGFVGSWLARRLQDAGATVHVLGSDSEADLTDVDSLTGLIEDREVGAVFHLAALSLAPEAFRSPLDAYEVNVRGTWSLLEACRIASAPVERVVVASTDRAYGAGEGLPYREDHGLKPRYPYDASKACADIVARSYADTYGLPVGVLRLANVFGGGDPHWSRLVPGTIRALLAGEPPEIRSNGQMMRDFLYVEDAVSAYLAVAGSLERPELRGRAWNASLGHPVTVLDVVRRLIDISGVDVEPDVRGEGFPEGEVPYQWLESSALRRELGWQPSKDLQQGLEATYSWYAENRRWALEAARA